MKFLNKPNPQLIGSAGVHFVASLLNAADLHAAATIRNVPGVDIVVSSKDGLRSITVQVKTAWNAVQPSKRLNFDCSLVTTASENLLFAFVDLRKYGALPDTYLVPSEILKEVFRPVKSASRCLLMKDAEWFRKYKNGAGVELMRRMLQKT